jgi:hypothetical protein
MFQDPQHAGYIMLMREVRPPRDWQPGDWLIERRDDGPHPHFHDSVWLPPLTHWLDSLRAVGIVIIEFTRDPDDPAVRIVRAWNSGPWRTSAQGQGPTDEEAAARCWKAVRRE